MPVDYSTPVSRMDLMANHRSCGLGPRTTLKTAMFCSSPARDVGPRCATVMAKWWWELSGSMSALMVLHFGLAIRPGWVGGD